MNSIYIEIYTIQNIFIDVLFFNLYDLCWWYGGFTIQKQDKITEGHIVTRLTLLDKEV